MPKILDSRRILIVEDEFLAALEMKRMVEDWGGTVAGPVGRLDQALELARSERLDGAILDVKMDGDTSYPVADELLAKGVPVLFTTGYDVGMLPERFADTRKLSKPFSAREGERAVREVFAGQ
jgi:CheY-like chemotaxis protein